jgi:hypothetical protein
MFTAPTAATNVFRGFPAAERSTRLSTTKISGSVTARTNAYGYTNGNDVTVCQRAYSHERSVLMVAGTLVHEFAHVNGAPGTTRQAEATLLACGLGRVYNPIIVGSRETPPSRIG